MQVFDRHRHIRRSRPAASEASAGRRIAKAVWPQGESRFEGPQSYLPHSRAHETASDLRLVRLLFPTGRAFLAGLAPPGTTSMLCYDSNDDDGKVRIVDRPLLKQGNQLHICRYGFDLTRTRDEEIERRERQKGSLGPKPPCRGADSSQTGGWKLDIHGIRNKSQESWNDDGFVLDHGASSINELI